MDYATIKLIHQSAVALSLTGFAVRGAGSLAGAPWVGSRLAKSLPQVIDTVLLLSALTLAWMLRATPARSPWLMAKLVGVVAYIALGVVALHPAQPRRVRAFAWLAALLVAGWIVSVAISKNPLGFLA